MLDGVKEGERDDSIFRFACSLESRGFSKKEATLLVLHAASRCSPPFSEKEALSKVNQAWEHRTELSFDGPPLVLPDRLPTPQLTPDMIPQALREWIRVRRARPPCRWSWWRYRRWWG